MSRVVVVASFICLVSANTKIRFIAQNSAVKTRKTRPKVALLKIYCIIKTTLRNTCGVEREKGKALFTIRLRVNNIDTLLGSYRNRRAAEEAAVDLALAEGSWKIVPIVVPHGEKLRVARQVVAEHPKDARRVDLVKALSERLAIQLTEAHDLIVVAMAMHRLKPAAV